MGDQRGEGVMDDKPTGFAEFVFGCANCAKLHSLLLRVEQERDQLISLKSQALREDPASADAPGAAEPERWRYAAHGVEHGPEGKRYTITVEFEDGQRATYEVDWEIFVTLRAVIDRRLREVFWRWRDDPLPASLDPKRRIEPREWTWIGRPSSERE